MASFLIWAKLVLISCLTVYVICYVNLLCQFTPPFSVITVTPKQELFKSFGPIEYLTRRPASTVIFFAQLQIF